MEALTSSEMRAWQTCQRGWWLGQYRGMRKRGGFSKLPEIGTLVHLGLEKYYRALMSSADPPSPLELMAEQAERMLAQHSGFEEQVSQSINMAAIMLEGYYDWLQTEGADHGLEVVGAEEMIEVPLEGTQFWLRGKIDARVRRESDGALLQLEHKTCGNLTDHPKWAQENPQFLTYDLLAFLSKPADAATDGLIINMLRRVKRTKAAKPPFYGRHEVRHNNDELRAHWKHCVAIGEQIAGARRQLDEGRDPNLVCPPSPSRNHLWSCDCAELGNMFDDGSNFEGYLEEFYEKYERLERYAPEEAKV